MRLFFLYIIYVSFFCVDHIVDLYGNSYLKHSNNGGQLETLAEVATPDTESGTPLLIPGENSHDRAVSQMSTHV